MTAETKRPGTQPPAPDASPPGRREERSRGATAEELKGISAVPTEGGSDHHANAPGAHPKPTPDDEVDAGVG